MTNTSKPRKCGVCGKKRKVFGFLNSRTIEFRRKEKVQHHIFLAVEGAPRICKQCNQTLLALATQGIMKGLQRL
jgi:hypothetical protein